VFRCKGASPTGGNAYNRYLRIEVPYLARGSLSGLPVMEPRAHGDRYRGPERRAERKGASSRATKNNNVHGELRPEIELRDYAPVLPRFFRIESPRSTTGRSRIRPVSIHRKKYFGQLSPDSSSRSRRVKKLSMTKCA